MSVKDNKIYCLQFVSQETTYFLPSISVLEILPFNTLTMLDKQPPWLQGFIDWRDLAIPIVDFSLQRVSEIKKTKLTRILIFYSLASDKSNMPYIGTVISQIPKSATINYGDFVFCDKPLKDDFARKIKGKEHYEGINATLVDLEILSDKVLKELKIPIERLNH